MLSEEAAFTSGSVIALAIDSGGTTTSVVIDKSSFGPWLGSRFLRGIVHEA